MSDDEYHIDLPHTATGCYLSFNKTDRLFKTGKFLWDNNNYEHSIPFFYFQFRRISKMSSIDKKF